MEEIVVDEMSRVRRCVVFMKLSSARVKVLDERNDTLCEEPSVALRRGEVSDEKTTSVHLCALKAVKTDTMSLRR